MAEAAKYQVPTLEQLNEDLETAYKNNDLKKILNATPPEAWLKKNSMANNAVYIPIDKVEFMLDRIFLLWKIEVMRE